MLFEWIKQENHLVLVQPGLHSKNIDASINYTDGSYQEDHLLEILSSAKDRSSLSVELADQGNDRFMEYHLSPVRGNLLRHLKINSQDRILEIGCGFGAMTRVLAEKNPAELIAIEGSLNRAKGARLRCSGLDHVNVIHANMHEIVLPESSFDIIVAVGVFEYIKLFYPNDTQLSSEALVVAFLEKLKTYLKPQGQIVIAIENQLGLKYFLGYEEDHFEEPYIGLYDYPGPRFSSIKTFGQKKWEGLFDQAGLSLINVQLPFPDYKFPHTVIEANFLNDSPYSANLLYNCRPLNYDNNFSTPVHTNLIWLGLTTNKVASAFADSFLFFVSPSPSHSIVPCDFVHYTSYKRQSKFWSLAEKMVHSTEIRRFPLIEDLTIGQSLPYVPLPLFALFLSQLACAGAWKIWLEWIVCFYAYLQNLANDHPNDHDTTFSNVLVDLDNKQFVSFDHEWLGMFESDVRFILFRSLLYWAVDNIALLSRFKQFVGQTIKVFISTVFQSLNDNITFVEIDAFMQKEIVISQMIFRKVNPEDFMHLLDLMIPLVPHPHTYQEIISQKNQEVVALATERFAIMQKMDTMIFDRDNHIGNLEVKVRDSEAELYKKNQYIAALEADHQFCESHPWQALWRRYTKKGKL